MSSPAYSLADYGRMMQPERLAPYAQALTAALRPGATVLDLGCGFGFFAILAAQRGAKHVYAVDPNPAIALGKDLAHNNHVSDRITFLQAPVQAVRLPEPVDILLSDLRGPLPLFGDHIPTLIDARSRLLAPGGVLIPQCDRLYGSLVSSPQLYADCSQPWRSQPQGVDLSSVRSYGVNTWRKCSFKLEQCLVPPQLWAVLDYRAIASPQVSGVLNWQLEAAGQAHGLGLWFEAELAPGIGFSNAPGQPELVYGKVFFPWQEPVALELGDQVRVALRAHLVQGEYIWQWRSQVQRGEARVAQFQQSNFFARPRSPQQLAQQSEHYRPPWTARSQAARWVLEAIAAGQSLGEMATDLTSQFPQQFPSRQGALQYAATLAAHYA